MIYLDGAATAHPHPYSLDTARNTAMEFFGNPSSLHAAGKTASAELQRVRNETARLLGGQPDHLVYTSGGTESNTLILTSLLTKPSVGEILTAPGEHASIREPLNFLARSGWKIQTIPVEKKGHISPGTLRKMINPETRLVTLPLVQSESGIIQPLEQLVPVIREKENSFGRPIHIHCDAVQALGKIAFSLEPAPDSPCHLNADTVSFSGHKIGAPRGIGILYAKSFPGDSLLKGGGQEGRLRGGTENLPGAAALLTALQQSAHSQLIGNLQKEYYSNIIKCRQLLIENLSSISNTCFLPLKPPTASSTPLHFSPWILSVAFPPVPGEVLTRVLSQRGICISRGSACSSRDRKKKPNLWQALGFPEKISQSAIRISFDWKTTPDDVEQLTDALREELPLLSRAAR